LRGDTGGHVDKRGVRTLSTLPGHDNVKTQDPSLPIPSSHIL
jgi:hypothetical protein